MPPLPPILFSEGLHFFSTLIMLTRNTTRNLMLAGRQRRSIIQVPDSKPKTAAGFLQDKDRIFQNIYGEHGSGIEVAQKLGDYYRTKDLLGKGPDWIVDQVL